MHTRIAVSLGHPQPPGCVIALQQQVGCRHKGQLLPGLSTPGPTASAAAQRRTAAGWQPVDCCWGSRKADGQ